MTEFVDKNPFISFIIIIALTSIMHELIRLFKKGK